MFATVMYGPRDVRFEQVEDPQIIRPTDAIVLVRLRIAEIHQHPIAHVSGKEAVEPGDRLRDALVIGPDHKAHVLGVELGRRSSQRDRRT